MTTQSLGQQAEQRAEKYLTKQGMRLVARNFHSKGGEIDLIMSQGNLLAFIEVRMRNNKRYGDGADSVDYRKQKKLIFTAQMYLQRFDTSQWQQYRFDVVSIGEDIHWIKNAFTLD